ncbi:MAG: hypothetical protein ABIF71_13555 [Planctomycetota bacterium]
MSGESVLPNVLVIARDPFPRFVLAGMLTRHGRYALAARSAGEALDYLAGGILVRT